MLLIIIVYSDLRYNVCEAPDPPVVGPSGPSHQVLVLAEAHLCELTGLTKSNFNLISAYNIFFVLFILFYLFSSFLTRSVPYMLI